MLFNEILSHNADICCFQVSGSPPSQTKMHGMSELSQELDQKEKIFPLLDKAGYSYVFKAGPKKKHGSLIAFRKGLYTEVQNRTVEYDSQTVRFQDEPKEASLSEQAAHGSSYVTKNIGNLVALRRNGTDKDGVIVATTHLFWHPRFVPSRLPAVFAPSLLSLMQSYTIGTLMNVRGSRGLHCATNSPRCGH